MITFWCIWKNILFCFDCVWGLHIKAILLSDYKNVCAFLFCKQSHLWTNYDDRKARNSSILIELKKQKVHLLRIIKFRVTIETEMASSSTSSLLPLRVRVGRVRVAYDQLDAVLLFRIFRNQHWKSRTGEKLVEKFKIRFCSNCWSVSH